MINPNGGFIAEVRNINDPYASGRYQLRIYGHHNNEQSIQDEHLPWGQFLQHAGSAATSKIGMLPTGPIVGSRVYGTFLDEAKQYPIILGVFPRGAKLSDSSNADVGQDGLDSSSYGIDSPVINGSANGNFGLTPNAPGLGGTAVNPTSAQFNQAPTIDNTQGQNGANTARQTHAPNADQPTIAAVQPTTNLPSALQQVGSSAQVLPSMINLLSEVQSMMNMNNSADSSNSQNPADSNLSGITAGLGQAFGAILVRISYHLGFDYVINVLSGTFSYNYNHIWELAPRYRAPVVQGILYLIQNYVKYTTEEAFVPPANVLANTVANTNLSNTYIQIYGQTSAYTTSNVVIITNPPNLPYPLVSVVPDYYIQRYFLYNNDPYPGYVLWLGPNGNYVFTVRTVNQPNYGSSTEDIGGGMRVRMYDYLFPLFQQGFLRAAYINEAFNNLIADAQNAANESLLGSGSSSSDSSLLSAAIAILGPIGNIIQSANTQHIPQSVFNQGSMTSSLQAFTTNIGALQQMKNISNTAFNSVGILSQVSNLLNSSLISTTSAGTLSIETMNYLENSGISNSYISSMNSILANSSISSNGVATMASVTKSLETAKAPNNVIQDVQLLLSEILVTNTVSFS